MQTFARLRTVARVSRPNSPLPPRLQDLRQYADVGITVTLSRCTCWRLGSERARIWDRNCRCFPVTWVTPFWNRPSYISDWFPTDLWSR